MRRFTLLTLTLLFIYAATAHAGDARIGNFTATAEGGKVSVRFTLDRAFDAQELNAALESGLPTCFTYHIDLFRSRPNWFDERINHAQIEVICTFNSVTREYLLNYRRNKRLVRSEVLTDLATLKQRMTSIDEPELFDIDGRRPYKLHVRARADLMRDFLLGLIPWDVSTGWRDTRVRSVTK